MSQQRQLLTINDIQIGCWLYFKNKAKSYSQRIYEIRYIDNDLNKVGVVYDNRTFWYDLRDINKTQFLEYVTDPKKALAYKLKSGH